MSRRHLIHSSDVFVMKGFTVCKPLYTCESPRMASLISWFVNFSIGLSTISFTTDYNREYGIEGRYNWRGSPYHMIIHALQTGTPFVYEIIGYCIRSKYTSDKYFIYKWSTRLQSMYNHMVGRTASVISLLFLTPCTQPIVSYSLWEV